MPTAQKEIEVRASREVIFDLIHDYSRRLEWDPFLREAALLDAWRADRGATSRCVARRAVGGFAMETVYISFCRPRIAAVKMTRGPWFLASFAAALRHEPAEAEMTRVIYRFSFQGRPRWLRPLIHPLMLWIFARETQRRLRALKEFLENDDG